MGSVLCIGQCFVCWFWQNRHWGRKSQIVTFLSNTIMCKGLLNLLTIQSILLSHKHKCIERSTKTWLLPSSDLQTLLRQWKMRSQLHVPKQGMVVVVPSMAQSVELAGQVQIMESPTLTTWAFPCWLSTSVSPHRGGRMSFTG